ncbi:hypothetical protein [Algihabitans sp.]|uniref:hypothetical protein n=1 Tax=Algihabitans sp. TaxID=2821514 RepID=UPI003BA852C6
MQPYLRRMRVAIPRSDDRGVGFRDNRGKPKLRFQDPFPLERVRIPRADERGAGLLESSGKPKLDLHSRLGLLKVFIPSSDEKGVAFLLSRRNPKSEEKNHEELFNSLTGAARLKVGRPSKSEKGDGFLG